MGEKVLTQEQALGILVQAAKVGQSKGAFSLEDAELIAQAVRVFTPPADKKVPAGEKAGTKEDFQGEADDTAEDVSDPK